MLLSRSRMEEWKMWMCPVLFGHVQTFEQLFVKAKEIIEGMNLNENIAIVKAIKDPHQRL